MSAAQERRKAKLLRLSAELSMSLALLDRQGVSLPELARFSGLPPAVVAGLVAHGRAAV